MNRAEAKAVRESFSSDKLKLVYITHGQFGPQKYYLVSHLHDDEDFACESMNVLDVIVRDKPEKYVVTITPTMRRYVIELSDVRSKQAFEIINKSMSGAYMEYWVKSLLGLTQRAPAGW